MNKFNLMQTRMERWLNAKRFILSTCAGGHPVVLSFPTRMNRFTQFMVESMQVLSLLTFVILFMIEPLPASDDSAEDIMVFNAYIANVSSSMFFFREGPGITGSFFLHPKNKPNNIHSGVPLTSEEINSFSITILFKNDNKWIEIPFPGFSVPPRLFKRDDGSCSYKFAIKSTNLSVGQYKAIFSIKYDDKIIEYSRMHGYNNGTPPFYISDVVNDKLKAMIIYDVLEFSKMFDEKEVFNRKLNEQLEGDKLQGRSKLRLLRYLDEYITVDRMNEYEMEKTLILWLMQQKYNKEYKIDISIPACILQKKQVWNVLIKNEQDIKNKADNLSNKYFPDVKPEYDIQSIDFKSIEQEVLSRNKPEEAPLP